MWVLNRILKNRILLSLLLGLFLAGCVLVPDWVTPLLSVPVQTDVPTATPATQPVSSYEPAATAQPEEALQPTPASAIEAVKLFYNLPPAVLTNATGLYASPNRGDLIAPVEIPAGETLYVMGRNATASHLRVVWNTGVGWVPVSFTNYNAARDRIEALPVFKREPPACAVPLATQFSLNSTWAHPGGPNLRIAVVVDLFRSQYGDFPASSLSLRLNEQIVESSRRAIVERGQFSLKDVVFALPGYLQPGDVLGYSLDTTSQEPLAFMATIFNVPESCVWEAE